MIVSLIFATRSINTEDTKAYLDAFEMVSTSKIYTSSLQVPFYFEIGFGLLMQAIKILSNDGRFFLVCRIINNSNQFHSSI